MLKHIVLMKLDADGDEVRQARSAQLSAALAALPAHIPEIRDLTVNGNVVLRPGNWDLALVVDFDDAADLEVYREHPEHQKVFDLINQIVSERSAVDVLT